jgi:hypothetical protein
MKKLFTLATLGALFAFGFTLTGCEEDTEVDIDEPAEVEPAPMPEPEPMPEPMPADTTMMEGDTTMAPGM